jgi:hypothetical protein
METWRRLLGNPPDASILQSLGETAIKNVADLVWKSIEWKQVHPRAAAVFHNEMAHQLTTGRRPNGKRFLFWRMRAGHHIRLARKWSARALACGDEAERCR